MRAFIELMKKTIMSDETPPTTTEFLAMARKELGEAEVNNVMDASLRDVLDYVQVGDLFQLILHKEKK